VGRFSSRCNVRGSSYGMQCRVTPLIREGTHLALYIKTMPRTLDVAGGGRFLVSEVSPYGMQYVFCF